MNALVYGCLVGVAAALYRRLLPSPELGALASLMFAVSSSHAHSVGWIAGRNTLFAALAALSALLLHVLARQERRRWLQFSSMAMVVVALATGEAGVGAFGYLLAYALVFEAGSLARRLASVSPQLVLGLVWAAIYVRGGYGLRGTTWYREPPPIRLPKGKMRKPPELGRAVELLARKTNPDGAILVVLDADDDCPAQLGAELLAHARTVRADRTISVVVATREYESWLIAGAVGLRGYRGLAADLSPASAVETTRDAKGWLDSRMQFGYHEATDQARLSERFDLEAAQQASSFSKLRRDLMQIVSDGSTHS